MLPLVVLLAAADPAPAPANVAATVNGEVVRLDEVDGLVRRLAAGPLTAAQTRTLRLQALDGLVDDLLVKQFLVANTPPPAAAEVDRLLAGLKAAQQRQGRTFADYLRETGQSEAQVRAAWETLLRFQKYVDERATDAELKKHFAANRDRFDGSAVRASVIVCRVPAGSPPGERVTARQKLAAVKADIAAGKLTFAAAAKALSIDPSAAAGGDIGFVTRDDPGFDDAVIAAAFTLPEHAVSDPIDADGGVVLVSPTGRRPGAAVPFERVEVLVRESFAEMVRKALVADLRAKATIQTAVP